MTYLSKLDWLGQLLTTIIYSLTKLGEIILDSAHIMIAVLNIINNKPRLRLEQRKGWEKGFEFSFIYIYINIIVRTELGVDST